MSEEVNNESPIAGMTPVMYPLNQLIDSPRNPRRIMSQAGIDALAASIRTEGFRPWCYVIARPLPEGGAELAAGHRRTRAARIAGLTEIPAVIMPMDDARFDELLAFENGGREDVHPLHEGIGWRAWLDAGYGTVEDIAQRIGQSASYVYKRVKCCELVDRAQRLWMDGVITESHAVQIARLDPYTQNEAASFCKPPDFDSDQRKSVRQLAAWIRENAHLSLARAPFDPNDATLPIIGNAPLSEVIAGNSVGACMECPKLAANNPELFGDLDPDTCTYAACYREKVRAADRRKQDAEREDAAEQASEPKPAEAPAPKRERITSSDAAAWKDAPLPPVEQLREPQESAREALERERARQAEERLRAERAEKVYRATVEAVIAKATWPPSVDVLAVLAQFIVGALDDSFEMAKMFAVPEGGQGRYQDLVAWVQRTKAKPEKLLRFTLAAALLQWGEQFEYTADSEGVQVLAALAKKSGVKRAEIEKKIDADIEARLGLRVLNPPPQAPVGTDVSSSTPVSESQPRAGREEKASETPSRKAAIAKLPALSTPAPAAKVAAPPVPKPKAATVKKAPAKKAAVKKSAKKGGKR